MLAVLIAVVATLWPVTHAASATVDLGPADRAAVVAVQEQIGTETAHERVVAALGLPQSQAEGLSLEQAPGSGSRLVVLARHADPRVAAVAADAAAVLISQDQGLVPDLVESAKVTSNPPFGLRFWWVAAGAVLCALAARVLTVRDRRRRP